VVWEADSVGDLAIPAKLAATAVAWEGDAGREWLARLPQLVDELIERWELEVGAPLEPGGNISWVAPVRRGDGSEVLLKIQLPNIESEPEARALRAWGGDGAIRVYDDDRERHALLIEWCRPGRGLSEATGTLDVATVGSAIGARLHRVTPPDGLRRLEEMLDPWADDVEEGLEPRPGRDPGLVRRALHTMRTRPRACPDPVFLHGDLNPTNVVSAEREPWLAIDPKPVVGDPAYDGPRLITQPDPLKTSDPADTLRRRTQIVADAYAVDVDVLREWCLVDAVEIGEYARRRGDEGVARSCDGHMALLAPDLP
jgi:streptomycin 6-kinase